jgi:translation initiation factor 2 alpha subunit (eIF-2alpha)
MPKKEAEAFSKILAEKKEKEKIAKKTISIRSLSESGINDIKEALSTAKNVEIRYLGSSKFSISAKGKDFKEANHKVLQAIEMIKSRAKEKKLFFEA